METSLDSNIIITGQQENIHPNLIIHPSSSLITTTPSSVKKKKKKKSNRSENKANVTNNICKSSNFSKFPDGSWSFSAAAVDDDALYDSHPRSSVKVVVRIRPVNRREREGVRIVQNLSSNSLSIEDRNYLFDAVLGPDSSQDDMFKAVGIPAVKDALAGFNTTILSYGETGSGKTYTMWGPPSAMLDSHSINSYQGIVPRIFHLLFSEIYHQMKSEDNEINYQCRCSFLEIYNEQINDILNPTQRNLQVRNDARFGFHVDNLTEEYVTTVEDVTQILVKGLSNRKVGATSMNSKGSRSHIIFTCNVESWCKGSSSKFFSNLKTSRISLVDLAGFEIDKVVGVGRHIIKESKHIKKDLSKLGKVVNVVAESACSGTEKRNSYTDSQLTLLLQDALGGNSKTTIICSISPNDRHRAGTLSTLRFGKKAKLIQNKALINEITEDHVNGLSDQIRQLKEELIQTKSSGAFKRNIARSSVNLLRASLNRALILHQVCDDPEEELNVNEDAVVELCSKLSNLPSSFKVPIHAEENTNPNDEASSEISSFQTVPSFQMPFFQDPTICSSPKIDSTDSKIQKSISVSSSFITANNASVESTVSELELENARKRSSVRLSLPSSKLCPTEYLAASLKRGLQIIDHHQKCTAVRRSPLGPSFDLVTPLSCQNVTEGKIKVGASILCSACKKELNFSECSLGNNCNSDMKNVSLDEETPEFSNLCLQKNSTDCVNPAIKSEHQKNILSTVEQVMLKENQHKTTFDKEREAELLMEIEKLKNQLKLSNSTNTAENCSLLDQIRNGSSDAYDNEMDKWIASESKWISLTEELRVELELNRKIAEQKSIELDLEKKCTAELDDVLQRSILGHTKMIEHYVDLQEEHNDLIGRHRKVMKCIEEVKKAAAKASSKKGTTSDKAFAAALAKEMSSSRLERERERDLLMEQNKALKIQLRDTAEAVNAAGELLVRLREAEESVLLTEKKCEQSQQENEKLRKQVEKMKKKHEMEMEAMRHYLGESRLPGSALKSMLHPTHNNKEAETEVVTTFPGDDLSWRTSFTSSYGYN